jgi:hypothetical protein
MKPMDLNADVAISHHDDLSWHDAPVPTINHDCWAQTQGWVGLNFFERCPCGAIRENRRFWMGRNTKRGEQQEARWAAVYAAQDARREAEWAELHAKWKAEDHRDLFLTGTGGLAALMIIAAFCWLTADQTFWYVPEAALAATIVGPLLVFVGVLVAHVIGRK